MTRTAYLFPSAALLLLSWGAFAFGAEFTWAYAPLLIWALTVAALGFLAAVAKQRQPGVPRALAVSLCLLSLAVLLQLVPFPEQVIDALSPARNNANYTELFARASMRESTPPAPGSSNLQAISIEPSRTWLGLAFLVAFSLLWLGSARGLHAVGPMGLVRGIVLIGAIAALAELVQKASGSSIIYGLWTPRQLNQSSAPFANRNHTAGWLVMVTSVAMGYLAGAVARGMTAVKPHWRDRVSWLSSPEGSEVLLTGFAIVVMATAIIFTESRSGALSTLVAIVLMGGLLLKRQQSRPRKLAALAGLIAIAITAAAMGGAETVGRRFSPDSLQFDGRLHLWRDTLRIINDFQLTGTGLNTYGIAMLHYQTLTDGFTYIEAHNEYLQIAAEGGWLLVVPALLATVITIIQVRQRFIAAQDDNQTYWIRGGAVIGLVAIAFQSLFDFTLQMPGAAAMFVILLALAVHRPGPRFSRLQAELPSGRPLSFKD